MAAGDDLRWTIVHCFNINERDEHIDNEAGQRDTRIVSRNIIRQRKMKFVIAMPPTALSGRVTYRILRHHVAVLAQDCLGEADVGFSHDKISVDLVIFKHAHHADATDMVAFLIVHTWIVMFFFH